LTGKTADSETVRRELFEVVKLLNVTIADLANRFVPFPDHVGIAGFREGPYLPSSRRCYERLPRTVEATWKRIGALLECFTPRNAPTTSSMPDMLQRETIMLEWPRPSDRGQSDSRSDRMPLYFIKRN